MSNTMAKPKVVGKASKKPDPEPDTSSRTGTDMSVAGSSAGPTKVIRRRVPARGGRARFTEEIRPDGVKVVTFHQPDAGNVLSVHGHPKDRHWIWVGRDAILDMKTMHGFSKCECPGVSVFEPDQDVGRTNSDAEGWRRSGDAFLMCINETGWQEYIQYRNQMVADREASPEMDLEQAGVRAGGERLIRATVEHGQEVVHAQ